jgi:hypothetical protein
MSIGWRPQQACTRPGDDRSLAADDTAGYGEVRAVASSGRDGRCGPTTLLATGLAAFGVFGTLGALDNQPTSRPPGARTRRSMTRTAPFPSRPIRRCSDVSSDPEVATADSSGTCSYCLIASDLRKWSPRSDSNRRPSDYESVPSLPAGPVQGHRGCSGAGTISSRPVPYRLVVAPGLPARLPRSCVVPATLPRSATSTIRSRSEGRSPPGAGTVSATSVAEMRQRPSHRSVRWSL